MLYIDSSTESRKNAVTSGHDQNMVPVSLNITDVNEKICVWWKANISLITISLFYLNNNFILIFLFYLLVFPAKTKQIYYDARTMKVKKNEPGEFINLIG